MEELWEYEKAEEHWRRYVQRRVEQREALERAGVPVPQMSEQFQAAMIERVYAEAKADFEERQAEVLLHNLAVIEEQSRRKGARRASWVCLGGAVMFVVFACRFFFFYGGEGRVLLEVISVVSAVGFLCAGLFLRGIFVRKEPGAKA